MIFQIKIAFGALFFYLILTAYPSVAQVSSEWRGVGRTGVYSNETNLLKQWPENGPELLWYADSLPKGYSSVATANGKVYITGLVENMDVLIAFNESGKKLWETPYGRVWDGSYEHSRSTPTIEGDKIYLSSGIGDVSCIDANTGEILWKVNAVDKFSGYAGKFGYSESLLVLDNKVFFTPCGNQTTMIALNKNNGEKVWTSISLKDRASYASPRIIQKEGKLQIIQYTENYLFAVNPENGSIIWKFNFGEYAGGRNKRNNQTNTPLFYNDGIYITSGYDHKSVMLSLNNDWTNVSVKWVDSILDNHHGGVVQIDGYIYGANWFHNRMGNWTCLNWETGKEMYSTEWENKGSIIAADGMLYCFEEKNGNLGIAPINPEEFKIVSSIKLPYGKGPYWAHPAISNGKLYMRSATALMVYNIKKE